MEGVKIKRNNKGRSKDLIKIEWMQILYDEVWIENRYDKEWRIPLQSEGFEI